MKQMSQPLMQYEGLDVFQLRDVPSSIKTVRLTKWLPATQKEFEYLKNEYNRIMCDPSRSGMVVYNKGTVALFVNDMTDGAFDKLGEEE